MNVGTTVRPGTDSGGPALRRPVTFFPAPGKALVVGLGVRNTRPATGAAARDTYHGQLAKAASRVRAIAAS